MADSKLRRALDSGETLVAPGVYDMISATIAEKVGFPAVFVGGYGVSASHLGVPDVGIMTFTDILERVRTFSAIPGQLHPNFPVPFAVLERRSNGYLGNLAFRIAREPILALPAFASNGTLPDAILATILVRSSSRK